MTMVNINSDSPQWVSIQMQQFAKLTTIITRVDEQHQKMSLNVKALAGMTAALIYGRDLLLCILVFN